MVIWHWCVCGGVGLVVVVVQYFGIGESVPAAAATNGLAGGVVVVVVGGGRPTFSLCV